jgi:hypothetical protein
MLNKAIQLFTGFGTVIFPQSDADRVCSKFSVLEALMLLQKIETLLVELGTLKPDCRTQTLISASHWAEEQMRQRHPGVKRRRAGHVSAGV